MHLLLANAKLRPVLAVTCEGRDENREKGIPRLCGTGVSFFNEWRRKAASTV